MTDLHLHTRFSFDSEESAENYIHAAKTCNAKCLGFSEHYDYDVYLEEGADKYTLPDLEAYRARITALGDKYPDMRILRGIELGYSPDAEAHYARLIAEQKFDYVILSVHSVKGRGDCYYPRFFEGSTEYESYSAYLRALLAGVRSELDYDIVGHLGYVARYAPYENRHIEYAEYAELIDPILKEIISRGKCLEINTSAAGTGDMTVPNTEIIDRYINLGGENFTAGSDAHSAARFADNFGYIKELLSLRGIKYVCRPEGGKLVREKL